MLPRPRHADYPYPKDEKDNPIDTPEWRDVDKLDAHAPKPHEKNAPDNELFKAIRKFGETGMGPVDAAVAAGVDINAKDKVCLGPLSTAAVEHALCKCVCRPLTRTCCARVLVLALQMGYTALHLAIKNKQYELCMKLVNIEGVDFNAKTNKGFTPMMVAAWKGDINMVMELIKKGADMSAKDGAGRNVWGVAHDWHKEEILELLKRQDFHYKEGDVLAFPPHPKWRPENRGK